MSMSTQVVHSESSQCSVFISILKRGGKSLQIIKMQFSLSLARARFAAMHIEHVHGAMHYSRASLHRAMPQKRFFEPDGAPQQVFFKPGRNSRRRDVYCRARPYTARFVALKRCDPKIVFRAKFTCGTAIAYR